MKKIIVTLSVLALTLISLTACQSQKKAADTTSEPATTTTTAKSAESSAQQSENTATLIITKAAGNSETKEVTVKEAQTVMDVLKENFTVEEKDGFITSIDGIAQDTPKNMYWMYDVNGEQAAKGAADTPIKADDKVEFKYEAYK